MQQKINIRENVPLAPLTTIKIGGKARFFVRATNEVEVIEAFRFAKENGFKIFILGGGSNILISDRGFDGLVLQIALKGISFVKKVENKIFLRVGAGEDWDEFVKFCVEKNYAGIECLSGIPGLVGGTPIQNVGAYGQEVSETIVSVSVFDRKTQEVLEFTNQDCDFRYRQSVFNTSKKDRFIILSVTYCLTENGAPKLVYKDLQNFFEENNATLEETRRAVLQIRSSKSMVINEQDPNSRSIGSFFKNPILSNEDFIKLKNLSLEKEIIKNAEDIPLFEVDEENVKIPAAWLIEKSGFKKGFALGKAGLSENHTLAIINRGDASAADVINLKEKIQKKVQNIFGISLQPEPIFVGFKD